MGMVVARRPRHRVDTLPYKTKYPGGGGTKNKIGTLPIKVLRIHIFPLKNSVCVGGGGGSTYRGNIYLELNQYF